MTKKQFNKVKVLILKGDELTTRLVPPSAFIFLVTEKGAIYCDTTIGKFWKVTKEELESDKDCLGQAHKKMLLSEMNSQ